MNEMFLVKVKKKAEKVQGLKWSGMLGRGTMKEGGRERRNLATRINPEGGGFSSVEILRKKILGE